MGEGEVSLFFLKSAELTADAVLRLLNFCVGVVLSILIFVHGGGALVDPGFEGMFDPTVLFGVLFVVGGEFVADGEGSFVLVE